MTDIVMYLAAICLGMVLSATIYCSKSRIRSKKISIESVENILDEANFWRDIEKAAKGEKGDIECKDTGYVYALMPCEYYKCACSESREDCCYTGVNIGDERYCRVLININRLCGLPDGKDKPDTSLILTEEEAKILGDKIVEFIKEVKREKA